MIMSDKKVSNVVLRQIEKQIATLDRRIQKKQSELSALTQMQEIMIELVNSQKR